MGLMTSKATPGQKLLDLLEIERECLKSGAYDKLRALAEQISDLTPKALENPDSEDLLRLVDIRAAARRNRLLIEAAQRGFQAARQRRQHILTGTTNSQTYDQNGLRHPLANAVHNLERRK